VPKIRNEVIGFAEINIAKPRRSAMVMHMCVENGNLIFVCELEGLSNGRRSHHRADANVVQIILVNVASLSRKVPACGLGIMGGSFVQSENEFAAEAR